MDYLCRGYAKGMDINMAIRGIDTQIMINRLPDNVREASDLLKRPEMAQDMLAVQGKVNDAQEQTRVTRTAETEMEQIRADVEGGGGAGYDGESGQDRGEKNDGEIDSDLLVPPDNHIIDITV